MRSSRVALVAAVLAATVLAVPAVAAPRKAPACRLLADARGDGHDRAVEQIASPALDILSADIATGRSTVVAVLRLASVEIGSDVATVEGARWALGVRSAGIPYAFEYRRSRLGDTYEVTHNGDPVSGVTAVVDTKAATVTWTVGRTAFRSLKPGAAFTDFSGVTSTLRGGRKVDADAANAAKQTRYVDRGASCVVAK